MLALKPPSNKDLAVAVVAPAKVVSEPAAPTAVTMKRSTPPTRIISLIRRGFSVLASSAKVIVLAAAFAAVGLAF